MSSPVVSIELHHERLEVLWKAFHAAFKKAGVRGDHHLYRTSLGWVEVGGSEEEIRSKCESTVSNITEGVGLAEGALETLIDECVNAIVVCRNACLEDEVRRYNV